MSTYFAATNVRFFLTALIYLLMAAPLTSQGEEIIHFADLDSFDNEFYDFEFNINQQVNSIESITIELSHSNAEQLEFTLENVGAGSPYTLFTLIQGDGISEGNSIGADDGDWGDFNGMSEITFVEFGSFTTVRNAGDEAGSGQYLAEDWENHFGSGTPPYSPSRWRFRITDNSGDGGHVGSVGFIRLDFTPVPEPTTSIILSLSVCPLLMRRRRKVLTGAI